MTKMVPLKKSVADRNADKDALGETARGPLQNPEDAEGPTVHLDHHHLKNMKVGGALKSRHSATLRLTHMGMEHEGRDADGDERANLRNEIEKIHGASEERREKGSEKKGAAGAVAGKKA